MSLQQVCTLHGYLCPPKLQLLGFEKSVGGGQGEEEEEEKEKKKSKSLHFSKTVKAAFFTVVKFVFKYLHSCY